MSTEAAAVKPPENPVPWTIITPHPAPRDAVKRLVAAAVQNDLSGNPAADQSQIDAAKTVLAARIDALPAEYNGCSVRAHGKQLGAAEEIYLSITGVKILV